jgi:hypothetical protein
MTISIWTAACEAASGSAGPSILSEFSIIIAICDHTALSSRVHEPVSGQRIVRHQPTTPAMALSSTLNYHFPSIDLPDIGHARSRRPILTLHARLIVKIR